MLLVTFQVHTMAFPTIYSWIIIIILSNINCVFLLRPSNRIAIDVSSNRLQYIADFFDVRKYNNNLFLNIFIAHLNELLNVVQLLLFTIYMMASCLNMRIISITVLIMLRRATSFTRFFYTIIGYFFRRLLRLSLVLLLIPFLTESKLNKLFWIKQKIPWRFGRIRSLVNLRCLWWYRFSELIVDI